MRVKVTFVTTATTGSSAGTLPRPGRRKSWSPLTGALLHPSPVGHRSWLGVRVDVPLDWDELADLIADAYRTVAPKRLVAHLDADTDG